MDNNLDKDHKFYLFIIAFLVMGVVSVIAVATHAYNVNAKLYVDGGYHEQTFPMSRTWAK